MRTCKEISVLVSEAHERHLGLAERLGLKVHLLLCAGCRNFRRQLGFIRAAARRYGDSDDAR